MKNDYDYSVSVTRVCAMLFIMICHLGSHFSITVIGQFFNVGVPIFFLISGYLYGNKEIDNIRNWISKRIIRLYIPLLMWGIMVLFASIARGAQLPSIREIILFLLNLQGLSFMLYTIPKVAPGPWFFTVIMFCYLATAEYQICKTKIKNIDKILFGFGGIIPLMIFIVLVYLGININGLLAYMVGFGLKKQGLLERKMPYNVFVSFIVLLLAIAIRLFTKRYCDGTILYDQILVPITHIMIAAAFFIGIKWLFSVFPTVLNSIASGNWFKWLDTISIYVYICHTWFLHELSFDIFSLGLPLGIGIVSFFVCSLMTASVLFVIGNKASRNLEKLAEEFDAKKR